MGSRLTLHNELKMVLENDNCYFQPPESVKLKYPCIVYHLYRIGDRRADNRSYTTSAQYTVTFIHKDPDDERTEKLLRHFPNCRMDRRFTSDSLYHDVFTIYY